MQRSADAGDGRAVRVVLADRGQRVLRQLRKMVVGRRDDEKPRHEDDVRVPEADETAAVLERGSSARRERSEEAGHHQEQLAQWQSSNATATIRTLVSRILPMRTPTTSSSSWEWDR